MKNIILIGGAPTVGKSTIAEAVAKHFDLPWISTDQIRDIMRSSVRREDNPSLFNPEGYETAEKFLKKFSASEIVAMEMEQGVATWPVVKKFIENDYTWPNGFVIEGVNILPHLVAEDLKDNKQIKAVFLVDEDLDRMRSVVFTRGLWSNASSYSDDVKEKEVEWANLFNHKIKEQAAKYGLPCVDVSKDGEDYKKVIQAITMN